MQRPTMGVVLGLAGSLSNQSLGIQLFGSPWELLQELCGRGHKFSDLIRLPATSLEFTEAIQQAPKLQVRGGPHAERLLTLLDCILRNEPWRTSEFVDLYNPEPLPDTQLPLVAAAAAGNLTHVARLLELGAAPDECGHFGMTPLHWAAASGHASTVARLRAAGASDHVFSWFLLRPSEVARLNGYKGLAHELGSHETLDLRLAAELTASRMSSPDDGRPTKR